MSHRGPLGGSSAEADDRRELRTGAMLAALWRAADTGLSLADHGEFVLFHAKFRAFRARQAQREREQQDEGTAEPPRKRSRALGERESGLQLPAKYDGRHRVNLSLNLDEHALGEACARQRDGEWARQPDAVEALQGAKLALAHFMDFQQKKRFKRLAQIARDRSLLPIASFHSQIVDAVRDNQVVVLAGDTGCGKSTQVPQFLLQCGCDRVVVTQPRRISAVSLTRRVALETNNEYGSQIAHQIRFDSSRTASTRVIFMTEGVLLRQAVSDPTLSQYDVIVLDEVHERHVSTDLLLGLLKGKVLPSAPNVRLVLMSATVNVALFTEYFNAPMMQIPGRLHPITVEYCPPNNAQEVTARVGTTRRQPQLDPSPYLQLMQRIDHEFSSAERGDVLVFLGGMDDIARLCEAARSYAQISGNWVVLPLHSSLAAEEQDKVFDLAPEGVRKLIVSTNIAETSVTIDGVRFVIDSGLEKEMRYDPACGVRSLMVSYISKASAEQRKGRAGRTGPGVCFRLYSEKDYEEHFDAFGKPEVQRMNLDGTLLQILAQGQDPRDFPFIDPPTDEAMAAALASLAELGALVELEEPEPEPEPVLPVGDAAAAAAAAAAPGSERQHGSRLVCTALGESLSVLPVDLPAGKMLLLSTVFHEAAPALQSLVTIAAALSVQSPLQRRRVELSSSGGDVDKTAAEKVNQDSFDSPHGDPFTLLNVFDDWMAIKKGRGGWGGNGGRGGRGGGRGGGGGGGAETFKWCKRHALQENRLYEMAKLKQQFDGMLCDGGFIKNGPDQRHGQGQGRGRRENVERKKQLRELQQVVERQRGQRVLRLDDGGGVEMDAGGDGDGEGEGSLLAGGGSLALDVRQLDFEISYKLDAPAQMGRDLSARDCNLMKLVLAASLYPNVAIPDEHNEGKKPSDVCFHTRLKKFVKLHPGSAASSDPASACGPGQVLCFTQLLETNYAYVLHPMPVSALHALLMFAKSVHTDTACTRIVCDGWLQLRLKHGGAGERLLLIAHQLRLLWNRLLQSKLKARKPRAKPTPTQQQPKKEEEKDSVEGQGWREDRTGDASNAADGAEKKTDTKPDDDEADVEPRAQSVPPISAKKLEKLPRFAQHVYRLRSLPPLQTTVERPDELLADKLAAFMAVPVEFVVERAKMSELAVDLGLQRASAMTGDIEEDVDAPPHQQSQRRKNGERGHAVSDGKAMQNLETESVLQGHGRQSGRLNGVAAPKRGHRLAPWLHYGSLRSTGSSAPGSSAAAESNDPQKAYAEAAEEEEESAVEEMRRFMGLSEHLQKYWRCPRCELKMLVNLKGARTHDRSCRVVMRKIGMVDPRRDAVVDDAAEAARTGEPPPAAAQLPQLPGPQLPGPQLPAEAEQGRPSPQLPAEAEQRRAAAARAPADPSALGPEARSLLSALLPADAAPFAVASGEKDSAFVYGPDGAPAHVSMDERLADAKRYFLVRASSKDRKVGYRRSADPEDCAPDGSTGLVADGVVVEAVAETKDWVQVSSGLWLPKEFLRSVETYENVLRYQR